MCMNLLLLMLYVSGLRLCVCVRVYPCVYVWVVSLRVCMGVGVGVYEWM